MKLKFIGIILCICLTSLLVFPVTLNGLPSNPNSKLVMAIVGIPVLIYNLSKSLNGKIGTGFILTFGSACSVSLAAYLSVVLNGTQDYTYVAYVVSMSVWTSATYLVIKAIQSVHGYVDVKLIILYLMVMCTLQCILALAIDMNTDIQQFVDRYYSDAIFFHEKKRMYGFGCGLDVAGGRFSAVLVMIAFLIYKDSKGGNRKSVIFCMICFIIVSVVGNMIGRTTTVGVILGLLIIIYSFCIRGVSTKYIKTVVGLITAFSILSVILYNSSQKWKENFEFGFEGFFSIVEKGEWEVHSNEMLKEGFVYPDNIKTWLIGDGYFEEPIYTDPYYIGAVFYGYYMGTDAGYSRFLFYFGLVGLLLFSAFFVSVAWFCSKTFYQYKCMFWAILLVNYIVWIKVSTDIYVTLAPFLCLGLMNSLNHRTLAFESDIEER